MENVAVLIVTLAALAVVTAASGAHVPEHHGVDVRQYISPNATVKEVPCCLKESCTLTCPFEGELQECSWVRMDKPRIPIVVRPLPHEKYQGRYEYRNITSMSLQQPGGGAVLIISKVQMKHQDVYMCSVTSSSGHINHYINLRLYTSVLNVSVHQEGQQLVCRADGIYPEPEVGWIPGSSGSNEPRTSVNARVDGLFTVSSSLSLAQSSPVAKYTCNISTPYSSGADTVTPPRDAAPNNPDLRYLWILLLPVTVVVGLLIGYHQKLHQKLCNKNTPTSGVEEPGVHVPLNSEGHNTTARPVENGHLNGRNQETAL